MRIAPLLYYFLSLIQEGHKWQWQDVMNTGKAPILWFSFPQLCAIIFSALYVYGHPSGITDNVIDTLLASMSIVLGFMVAVVILVYDRYREIGSQKAENDDEKIKKLKLVNFLKQYNALSFYAIFLGINVIIMMIGTLMFGQELDIKEFITRDWKEARLLPMLDGLFVGFFRVALIYFVLDFYLITFYAVCSLFQFINVQMLSVKCSYQINHSFIKSEWKTLTEKFSGKRLFFVIVIALLIIVFSLIHILLPIL